METTTLEGSAGSSHPASRIGSYEVLRPLGRGATAIVYECFHAALGRRAAVKVLHPHLAHDCVAAARFLREGRVLSRIVHPNVVQVLDVGRQDGLPYLVMSLVVGNDLGEHLALYAPMPVADIVDCILPIVSAVAAAHDAGIVHRDLKPGNVRLTRDHRGTLCPVVLDFGISKVVAEGKLQELTDTNTVLGTVNYMSPEQMRSPKEVDARSDIYSLGVILYQCATGKRPFEGANAYDVMHAIMTASVPPPSFFRSEIPKTFDSIVLRAMRREPLERFASARELGRALSPFASDPTAEERKRVGLVAHELGQRCTVVRSVTSRLQVILWRDIFVVIDDGRADAGEYPRIAKLVAEQSKRHQHGIGGLSVIPPNAQPPTPEARRAISDLLVRLGSDLRCVCWLVEGGGFQGAMARAVLTGLRTFGRYPYATHVSTGLDEALGWMLKHLTVGDTRFQEASTGAEFIRAQRERSS